MVKYHFVLSHAPWLACIMLSSSDVVIAKVRQGLHLLGLEGQGLVVAVSGGPDSVALLHALVSLGCSSPLIIAHVNHQLRGAESDEDEAFVQQLGQSLRQQGHSHVRTSIVRLDVGAIASERGENLEAAARTERYRWLEDIARQHGVGVVATGHTADDQAETVLQRLLRGSGIQGLRGIALRRPLAEGVELVRPLLAVTREEVQAFLTELELSARQDSSNEDLRFTRNRIRHQLLPLLKEQFNPAIREILGRLAEEASEVFEEEHKEAENLLAQAELPRAGKRLIFNHGILIRASRRRVRLLFRLVWEREGWEKDGMTREHWKRLEAVVFDALPAVDLPGKLHARRREGVIQLGPT